MKKILVTLMFVVMLFGFTAVVQAEDVLTPALSLNGDVLCVIGHNGCTAAGGVGVNFATIGQGTIELRAEAIKTTGADSKNLYGIGAGVNIAKVIERVHGTWKVPEIIPTVGLLTLFDIQDMAKPKLAVYLSLLKVKF